MAFRSKYRRYRSSYRRRGRSGYTMYKLYKNRSSAAQSRQIYGLNKKMKRIQRLTRPEINIAPLVQGNLVSEDGTNVNGVHLFGPISLTNIAAEGDTVPEGAIGIQGRFARLQNITLKGVFTYRDGTTPDLEPVDLQRMVGYLRVVLVQTKSTRGSAISPSDVFSTTVAGSAPSTATGTTGLLAPFSMIRAPLKYGAARVIKVLSDKTYMISDTKQAVNIKTKLKYVRNWYKAPNEDGPKGEVFMFAMMYDQTNDQVTDVSICRFYYVSKCVYTDA